MEIKLNGIEIAELKKEICFSCMSKMNDTVQDDLNDLKKFFKSHKKEYEQNKTKWEKVALLSKLKSNEN